MRRALAIALIFAAALVAHAQMPRGFSSGSPRGFHGGVIIGNRGFVSHPFHHRKFSPQPFFPLGVAVPLWWDEPEIVEAPPPQPVVVVVDRDQERDSTPDRVPEPALIIEREGDRYVPRAANHVAPASRRPAEQSNAPLPPVIVLRNGEQIELTDYAITTDALYDLRGGRTVKIQLADVDLSATTRANQHRGVMFSPPFP